jgi:hypothetical protein
MIVNSGDLLALDQLLSNLTGSIIELVEMSFMDNDPLLGYMDMYPATWSGGGGIALGIMPASTLDGSRAKSTRSAAMVFGNTSGSSKTAYGWMWSFNGTLIGVKAFPQPESIADGGTLELTPSMYMDNLTL